MPDRKKIGILGGMGPASTVYLFGSIVNQTYAASDQDHIEIIIHNNTSIPDRSDFILGRGPDPVPALVETSLLLQKDGADFIIIPCNTAHYFIEKISRSVKIPVINMIDTTSEYLSVRYPTIRRVGLLSTLGAYQTGLYQDSLKKEDLECIIPGEGEREEVMDQIYGEKGIKAGYNMEPAARLTEHGERLIELGAQAIIAGCTEIAMVLNSKTFSVPLLNPLDIMARHAILEAGYRVRSEGI